MHKPYLNSNTHPNLWVPSVFEASEGTLLICISHTWTVTLTLICEHLHQSFEGSEGILLIGISHTWTVTLTLICECLHHSFWGFWSILLIGISHTWTVTLTLICEHLHQSFWGFWRYIIDRHKPYLNSNTNPKLWVPSSVFSRVLKVYYW